MPQSKLRQWLKSDTFARERIHAEIDWTNTPAIGIYEGWNLRRFCAPRTFREYVAKRRARSEAKVVRRNRESFAAARVARQQDQGGGSRME